MIHFFATLRKFKWGSKKSDANKIGPLVSKASQEALHQKVATILRDVEIANYSYADTAAIFFVGGTALALYFMYNIRHTRKPE